MVLRKPLLQDFPLQRNKDNEQNVLLHILAPTSAAPLSAPNYDPLNRCSRLVIEFDIFAGVFGSEVDVCLRAEKILSRTKIEREEWWDQER